MADNLPYRPPLTAHEVEEMIQQTLGMLEELVEDYAEIAENAAVADVDFKRDQAVTLLGVMDAAARRGRKMTADERAARVEVEVSGQRRVAAIAGASRESAREAMNTHRTRLEALRTLAANVRAVTTERYS